MDIVRVALEPNHHFGRFFNLADAELEIDLLEEDYLVLDIVQYLNAFYVVSSDWMKENNL